MHGRLKIKTTAQQEAEKKKERAVKLGESTINRNHGGHMSFDRNSNLAGYRQAMGAILSRRKEGARDEKQLKLSAGVLMANPDIHTLWNIRRESVETILSDLEKKQEQREEEEETGADISKQTDGDAINPSDSTKSDDNKEDSEEKPQDVSDDELRDSLWMKEVELTGQCLLTNPKSYGAWHHRCYSLDKMR